jgi:integrase
MARVNIVKRIKINGRWVMRSIPRKQSGNWDWNSLPDGRYYVEWYEQGTRRREPAGTTVAQALEVQRRRRHLAEGQALGLAPAMHVLPAPDSRRLLRPLVDRHLDQVNTLKKPNTYRKYEAVLNRFCDSFHDRSFESISTEELNDFVVHLKKSGMQSNTVLHNVVIIAQFFKRNGRSGIMRQLQLPERSVPLPKEYREADLAKFFDVCDPRERAVFATFLMTGFREQEIMYLFWTDVNLALRTVRVTAKRDYGFSPKRWEEREVPITGQLAEVLQNHPRRAGSPFVFPSPTGNREQHMLDHCKAVASRAGLDSSKFDLKTFRSTYATRMLRSGFDVRTVQSWMGHKSLETTMRYLVPASDVHARLDQVEIPGLRQKPAAAHTAITEKHVRPAKGIQRTTKSA